MKNSLTSPSRSTDSVRVTTGVEAGNEASRLQFGSDQCSRFLPLALGNSTTGLGLPFGSPLFDTGHRNKRFRFDVVKGPCWKQLGCRRKSHGIKKRDRVIPLSRLPLLAGGKGGFCKEATTSMEQPETSGQQWYKEQREHPLWKKRRQEVLEQHNYMCDECGTTSISLHVHHKYYDTGKSAWDYPDYCFACLCNDCHREAHFQINFLLHTLVPATGLGAMSAFTQSLSEAIDAETERYGCPFKGFRVVNCILWALASSKDLRDLAIDHFRTEFPKLNPRDPSPPPQPTNL
jgi:5-methylcytosine-specific restriction endonuclease McrA